MKYKTDKGVAGLTILLSLVVTLFVIGLIVMIFTLMSSELQLATFDTKNVSVTNQQTTMVMNASLNTTGSEIDTVTSTLRDCVFTASSVKNHTGDVVVTASNYSIVGCKIYPVNTTLGVEFNNAKWNITGSYTYSATNDATRTINASVVALAETVDWFDIFIVIGAMVVLILLTVIIVTAIRGSGMTGGNTSGAKSIGTA